MSRLSPQEAGGANADKAFGANFDTILEGRKQATLERQRRWRKANPDKVRATKQKCYAKHAEKARAYSAAYRLAHPEKVKQQIAKARERYALHGQSDGQRKSRESWSKRNPEKIRESSRNWNIRNPEKRKRLNDAWKEKSPEVVRESSRRHRLARVEIYRAYCAARRARKRMAMPDWAEPEIIELIYATAAHRGLTVDHVIPLKSDLVCGLHVHANLQLLTGSENSAKGNRFESYAVMHSALECV